MMGYAILGVSVLTGYCVTVLCALLATMSLGSLSSRFVIANHRVRGGYKLAHEMLWLLCVTLGAYTAARVGVGDMPWRQELVLTLLLVGVLWRNTWEARQRGTAHQILITLLTVAGVIAGFSLRNRLAA